MEITINPIILLVGTAALGWLWQWARAPKGFPNWLSYTLAGVAAAFLVTWAVPGFEKQFATDWRAALITAVAVLQAMRGSAATSKDVKLAPATDSK